LKIRKSIIVVVALCGAALTACTPNLVGTCSTDTDCKADEACSEGLCLKRHGPPDAGPDAGLPDAGPDAGLPDAGPDAGLPDAGPDAGSPDAGPDAGSPDAGPDAGSHDAGPDAGSPDAGPDAGSPDAGPDAGVAHVEAGSVGTGAFMQSQHFQISGNLGGLPSGQSSGPHNSVAGSPASAKTRSGK
jgi:hypothetical protein